MDLKSMLNDSASRPQPPPRLHTSSSSISERNTDPRASYDAPSDRPPPQGAPVHAPDPRAVPPGSYFPVVSPQQYNSASTPSAGAQSAHSAYAQSPGPAQQFTPRRESIAPHHIYTPGHIPPPSPIGATPSTPGSQYHPSGHSVGHPGYGQQHPPPNAGPPRPGAREDYAQPNGRPSHQSPYQMSPPPPQHPQTPSTPLGPPPSHYPRPPIHPPRPMSQGQDHLRRASIGSVGSAHSRDPSMSYIHHPEINKAGSQRTYSADDERHRQDRERSDESVSPKTIPRPPPQRNSSQGLHSYEQSPVGSVTSHTSHPAHPPTVEQYTNSITSTPIHQQALHSLDARTQQMSRPSPNARPAASMTPQSTHSSLPPTASPVSTKPPPKKRSASVISNTPVSSMPPHKKIKREEKPIWAQSARKRQLRLDERGPRPRQPRTDLPSQDYKRETTPGHPQKNGTAPQPPPAHEPPVRPPPPQSMVLDESILPEKPRNDLVFTVCEWLWGVLGHRTPPPGSVLEIEGKLGVIWDDMQDARISIPVRTEAVFDKARAKSYRPRFDTSVMTEIAHKGLNDFLNHAINWNRQQIASGIPLRPIEYAHPVEWDEYYEMTREGQADPSMNQLSHWFTSGHAVKVRRTFDKKTGEMKAQIIKTRVQDLEIYNPNEDFDFRISISLETPWNGPESHLKPPATGQNFNDRLKDRLSYKHRDYQIDLTQIGHNDPEKAGQHEHEVEVEINNDSFSAALENARAGSGDQYEKCIGGFVDNIRILASHATRAMRDARAMAQQRPPGA